MVRWPRMHHSQTEAHDLQACIEACARCHEICEHMLFSHCAELGGKHVEAEHLKLMADCVQICAIAADFMSRGSPRHLLTCGACAEICGACADDCERIGDMEDCVK